MWRKLGKYEAAAADYGRALSLAPGSVRAYNNLAFCLAKLGRYAEAVSAYDTVLSMDPSNVHAHHNRSVPGLAGPPPGCMQLVSGWAPSRSTHGRTL